METHTVGTVTFLAEYAEIRNFTKHIFKKHRISCHNLFLLGKRGPTRYLTLQEDHNVSICGLFLFWASGPKYPYSLSAPRPPKKVKFHIFFYQNLTDNMALKGLIDHKKVKRTKLIWVCWFWGNGPKYGK